MAGIGGGFWDSVNVVILVQSFKTFLEMNIRKGQSKILS